MMSLNMPPPADVPATLATLSDLVSLRADAKAAMQRVAEMQKASEEYRDAAEALRIERANFALAEATHNEALSKATAEQADKLAAERLAFDQATAARKSELDSRADQLTVLQAKAQLDGEAATKIRADLERRLSLIRDATGD